MFYISRRVPTFRPRKPLKVHRERSLWNSSNESRNHEPAILATPRGVIPARPGIAVAPIGVERAALDLLSAGPSIKSELALRNADREATHANNTSPARQPRFWL
jgi:hypothetical protein